MVLILILAIVGMDWVTRVQKLLLVILMLAQVDMIIGTFFQGDNAYVGENKRKASGYTSWNVDTIKDNIYEN